MCVCHHLQAIWENQFYYLFGFLFLVFIILVVSCSQISIVMVYFQLCAEVSSFGAMCKLDLTAHYQYNKPYTSCQVVNKGIEVFTRE